MSITPFQYSQMVAACERNSGRMPKLVDPVEDESELHEDIIRLCKSRGWYYVRSRMDRATTQAIGVPDFIIAADDGKSIWIECKAKGNKPTNEQLATITFLRAKGHVAGICYNMTDVAKLIYESQNNSASPSGDLRSGNFPTTSA